MLSAQIEPERESAVAPKYCPNCERKLSAERKACPRCGLLIAGSDTGGGSGHGRRYALGLVLALVVVNVYSVMARETGPPPEVEALHS